MPINIPAKLPAAEILTGEGIFVMTDERASSQEIGRASCRERV